MTPSRPRLLDVSRLASRAGRMLTGVDRVERAYLRALLGRGDPLWGLCRTRWGYLLLDRTGLEGLAAALEAGSWDIARLRRMAMARAPRMGLRALLRQVPDGAAYLNVGHSNLNRRTLDGVATRGMQVTVLIHDVIPIQFPHFQRPGVEMRFDGMIRRVAQTADLVIYNSADTAARARLAMEIVGRVPPDIVAHLGVERAAPDPGAAAGLGIDGPYFVTVGTIEPRKNHALLLDVWEAERPDATLVIAGSRGWNNAATFARLDARPPGVIEAPGLGDAAVAGLMAGARGLLFPTFAEGFGLPPLEAASLGTPVVVADLPVLRELMGDIPVYASPHDAYPWRQAIKALLEGAPSSAARPRPFDPPTWQAHFNAVLTRT
ncbi:MAG: glycosyltransferase family 4 protein [Shimia sp.]